VETMVFEMSIFDFVSQGVLMFWLQICVFVKVCIAVN
jgi:hypothetical protein